MGQHKIKQAADRAEVLMQKARMLGDDILLFPPEEAAVIVLLLTSKVFGTLSMGDPERLKKQFAALYHQGQKFGAGFVNDRVN